MPPRSSVRSVKSRPSDPSRSSARALVDANDPPPRRKGRAPVRVGQRLGKYRIERRLAEGGFATVFNASDQIAGVRVALKIPHIGLINENSIESFRREVRLASKVDHPNILPIKDAGFFDGIFVIAYPLGDETLADRLTRRHAPSLLLNFAGQMLEAVAAAHRGRIMHCDLKPENFILFPENRLRLADFGIAKVAMRTLIGSGSGTVGYLAPEQALGKPSIRSDVFSLGLILYRMFAGRLPEWPFVWPPPGIDRLRQTLHPKLVDMLRRALEVDSRKRFPDAGVMLRVLRRVGSRGLRTTTRQRKRRRERTPRATRDWRTLRKQEFLRRFGKRLDAREHCGKCQGPMAETMQFCPWCAAKRAARLGGKRWPTHCPRCRRGMKSDWRFCPWCYGAAVNPDGAFRYSDKRYTGKCANAACGGRHLMPFMRYCPWCRRKVTRAWAIEEVKDRCPRCRCGVLREFWDFCPWCARAVGKHSK